MAYSAFITPLAMPTMAAPTPLLSPAHSIHGNGRISMNELHLHSHDDQIAKASFATRSTATAILRGESTPKSQAQLAGSDRPSDFVTVVMALCREERLKEALGFLQAMYQQSIPIHFEIYVCLLQTCANMNALDEGKQIHEHMLLCKLDQNVVLGTKLVTMYAMCGSLDDARQVFDKIAKRNVFLWTAMVSGYVRNGLYDGALSLFFQMQREGIHPDKFTYSCVLKACAGISALQRGNEIHGDIIKDGLDGDIFVGSALIDMYGKCGRVDLARQVFDKMPVRNVVSWNAMIMSCTQNEHADEALKLFRQMQQYDMRPSSGTLASILPALAALQWVKEIHAHIIRSGFESNEYVGSALVAMYTGCRTTEVARKIFDKMSQRDVVSWSAMIKGYTQNGQANEALKLFRQMHNDDVKPTPVAIASVLPACGGLALLQQGKEIHACIIKNIFDSNVFVWSALIDMYAKCGSVEIARQVFDKITQRDVIIWTAMIAGYGMNGQGENALKCFHLMENAGVKPNEVTFLVLLYACSHSGLVAEGCQFFYCMSRDYHMTPRVEHYACMVDLLGRAGRLDDAENFIRNMPIEPNVGVWGALLGACRIHCNIELGERVAEHLFEIDPENAGNYVLLSNIYASAGRWDDVEKVRTMMKERGAKTRPGCSWINVKNRFHAFLVGDKSHPQSEKIYAMLESLAGKMEEAGYVPATNFMLRCFEVEKERDFVLCGHSERLAIAFGLINTCPGMPIQITKNLRVCGDCHSATKFISKIADRQIIVRDANRFHHFKDGACSCGDYW